MKRLLVIIFLTVNFNLHAQQEYNFLDCDCSDTIIVLSESAKSLFNSDKIMLLSFNFLPTAKPTKEQIKSNIIFMPHQHRLGETLPEATKTGTLNFEHINEFEILNTKERDKLKNILFSCEVNKDGGKQISMCYNPRNAIFFLDKEDKVKGYIELCFECRKMLLNPKNRQIPLFCEEKYENIITLFKEKGIKKGIEKKW